MKADNEKPIICKDKRTVTTINDQNQYHVNLEGQIISR